MSVEMLLVGFIVFPSLIFGAFLSESPKDSDDKSELGDFNDPKISAGHQWAKIEKKNYLS